MKFTELSEVNDLTQHGDMLELFCQFPEDEAKFFRYFKKHPDVI